jgi:hypothetical protein
MFPPPWPGVGVSWFTKATFSAFPEIQTILARHVTLDCRQRGAITCRTFQLQIAWLYWLSRGRTKQSVSDIWRIPGSRRAIKKRWKNIKAFYESVQKTASLEKPKWTNRGQDNCPPQLSQLKKKSFSVLPELCALLPLSPLHFLHLQNRS